MTIEVNITDSAIETNINTIEETLFFDDGTIEVQIEEDTIDIDLGNRFNKPTNFGSRSSAIHAGIAGEEWYDDDWKYQCVQTGSAGNAIWKKTPYMNT